MLCKAGDLSTTISDPAWRNIVFRYKLDGVSVSMTILDVLMTYESLIRDITVLSPKSVASRSFSAMLFFAAQRVYMKTTNIKEVYRKWKREREGRPATAAPTADLADAVACGIKECLGQYCEAVHQTIGETNSLVVMGHTHGPLVQCKKGFKYINSGGWASTGKDSEFAYVEIFRDYFVLHLLNPSKSTVWTERTEELYNCFSSQ